MSYQPALASLSDGLKTQDLPFQLDIGHVTVYLVDVIQTASVHIFIGEIIQQVMQGKEIQFLVQHRSPLRANALQILYVAGS
jgi:hypothetical protein